MTLPKHMILIDFETNGAKIPGTNKMDTAKQYPVEVCAVRVIDGNVTAVYNSLVYYDGEWSDALQNGHHNREELLQGSPYHTVSAILWAMLIGEEPPVLVAYNALFDANVLNNMLMNTIPGYLGINTPLLCPLTIARERYAGSHKLVDACTHYGIQLPGAHMAYDDVMGTLDLLKALDAEGDVSGWVNHIGYKRQYGEPEWYPPHVTLRPQGAETYYHSADGAVKQQTHTGRPFQQQIMGKPVPVRPKP